MHRCGVVVAMSALMGVAPLARVQAVEPPPPVADGAGAEASAERGPRTQVEPLAPAPTYGGCMKPGIPTSPVAAPGGVWQLGTVNGKWRIGFRGVAGPLGAIVVVGDSLTYLSIAETMAGLVSAGYGPICVDAGYGRFVVVGSGTASVSSGLDVIGRVRASAPVWQMDTVRWVIALGTNDVRRPSAGRAPVWCAEQIAAARWAIGVTARPPEWVNVRSRREIAQYVENVWNTAVPQNGFVTIDWSAAVAPWPELFISDDLVHPTPFGTELRVRLLTATASA